MQKRAWVLVVLSLVALEARAQTRVQAPAPAGEFVVTFTERSDEGQAARLRDVAARVKPLADQLENLERIEIVVVHSQRELDLRLGLDQAGSVAGVSYLHGILFLSPLAWTRNPTDEALTHEMQDAMIRLTVLRLTGGHAAPDWLTQGLVANLTKRPFAAASVELIVQSAPLLLLQWRADDPAVGYWAVRYLLDARGGLTPVRQLLHILAQRPDSFVENLELVYGTPVGDLERDWRAWLQQQMEEEKRRRQDNREGPLVRDR